MELFILCFKIFFVRIIDVSMGTFRTIITVKGNRIAATMISFFETLIWFLVVKEALNTDINSIWIALSYAGGFATGTYLGTFLSTRFIKGTIGFQVILSSTNDNVVNSLRNNGYAVSVVEAKGQQDKKYMLFIEVDNKKYDSLVRLIKSLDDKAFIIVNDTKYVINGYFGKN